MAPPEFPSSHSFSELDFNFKGLLVMKITFLPQSSQFLARAKTGGKVWGETTPCIETTDLWLTWTRSWKELQLALGSEAEDCSSGVCNSCCADTRDASESQVDLCADTSHETPRMAAECRTVIGEAVFTEAEHSAITNNTELATYVCFRTCKRHGVEARRREIRFH